MAKMSRTITPRRAARRGSWLVVPVILALSATALAITSPALAADAVNSQVLAAPAGVSISRAMAINGAGVVAGVNQTNTDSAQLLDVYVWSAGTGMQVLGSLGGDFIDPRGISDGGHIVGNAGVPHTGPCDFPFGCRDQHAFRWVDGQGALEDLGTLGGSMSAVYGRGAVNTSGTVVGVSQTATNENRGFMAASGQAMVPLAPVSGGTQSDASAINSAGVVAGESGLSDGSTHAVIWTPSATSPAGMAVTDIGALPGSSFSRAIDINDAGQVAGFSNVDNRSHAFLWSPGTGMQDLGTLAGSVSSTVVALSETGQVVGQSGESDRNAYSWTPATGMVDLGSFSGGLAPTTVLDVSDTGQVVGSAYTANDASAPVHAFSWTSGGGIVDLTPDTVSRSTAQAVNNSGQIAGNADEALSTLWTVGAAAPAPGSITPTPVTGGETVATDPSGGGATAAVPVQTSITVPSGLSGTVSVTPQPLGTSPTGFDMFGRTLLLEGPAASVASPYKVTFTIDGGELQGVAPGDVQVFREGVAVADCTSPTQAIPDPCVQSRGPAPIGPGDAQVTVRTSHFSHWNVGKLSYALKAGLEPVNLAPVVNTMKAGSAVPVRFKLGGNRGLDVFSAGFPKSTVRSCTAGPRDEVEVTLPLAKSSLVYERITAQYVYVWKTDKAWRGCRDLVLGFKDGSSVRANFLFR